MQNLSQIAGIADPLAQQFGSTSSSGSSTSQTQVPAWQQLVGGLLGGAALAAKMSTSDARVKRNKVKVGALHDGTPVYAFNYVGDPKPRIGLLAQDVERRRPDAVREVNGVKLVDYGKAAEFSGILGKLFGGR